MAGEGLEPGSRSIRGGVRWIVEVARDRLCCSTGVGGRPPCWRTRIVALPVDPIRTSWLVPLLVELMVRSERRI